MRWRSQVKYIHQDEIVGQAGLPRLGCDAREIRLDALLKREGGRVGRRIPVVEFNTVVLLCLRISLPTQGDGMKKSLGLSLLTLSLLMTSVPAHAEVLQPAHVFTLRDLNNDGSVDAIDDKPPQIGVPSFQGFVSRLPGFTDETFVEFDISSLGAASQATLTFTIGNLGGNFGAATLPIATYSGSGKTNISLYRTQGSPWQTLQVAAPQPGVFCCSLSFDVTALYNHFKNSGSTHLGFRLHDPSWSGLTSQGQVFFNGSKLEVVALAELSADIDIRPGSGSNPFNPKSNGIINVAILTTSQFDATKVNASTVRFGVAGTEAASVHTVLTDVDGDGDIDMVVHVRSQETRIPCGANSAVLKGLTLSGEGFRGQGGLRTVGCHD